MVVLFLKLFHTVLINQFVVIIFLFAVTYFLSNLKISITMHWNCLNVGVVAEEE